METLSFNEQLLFKGMIDRKEKDLIERINYHTQKYKLTLGIEHKDLIEEYQENLVSLQSLKKKVLTQLM